MNVPSAEKVTVQSFASSRQVPARSAAVAGFSVGAADEGDAEGADEGVGALLRFLARQPLALDDDVVGRAQRWIGGRFGEGRGCLRDQRGGKQKAGEEHRPDSFLSGSQP